MPKLTNVRWTTASATSRALLGVRGHLSADWWQWLRHRHLWRDVHLRGHSHPLCGTAEGGGGGGQDGGCSRTWSEINTFLKLLYFIYLCLLEWTGRAGLQDRRCSRSCNWFISHVVFISHLEKNKLFSSFVLFYLRQNSIRVNEGGRGGYKTGDIVASAIETDL